MPACVYLLSRWHVVTHTRFCQQVPWPLRLGFEFSAQASDIRPQVIRLITVLSAPHRLQDLPVCQELASVAGQIREHLVLFLRQRNVSSFESRTPRREVDLQVLAAVGRKRGLCRRVSTSQGGAQAGQQLLYTEWLGEVVIGAEIERLDL